jgi:hypothetical protein
VSRKLSDQALRDDFQRMLTLVDTTSYQPTNLLYNYHWTVSKELDKRSESEASLKRALKLAEQR